MSISVLKKHMTIDQLILLEVCKSKNGKSIKELERNLQSPRNTIVGYLNTLERDDLINSKVVGRTKRFYPAIPELTKKLSSALENLKSAYIDVIRTIAKKQLKELKIKDD